MVVRTAARWGQSMLVTASLAAISVCAAQSPGGPPTRWSLLRGPDAAVTLGQDINNAGTIVGFYVTNSGGVNFIKRRGGEFVPFNIPEADAGTQFGGINNGGTATGTAYTSDGSMYAFIRLARGPYRILPRFADQNIVGTRITDHDRVIGTATAIDPYTYEVLTERGVMIDTTHRDRVTYFDYPDLDFTNLVGGNDRGFVAGWATSSDFSTLVWFTAREGHYEPFQFPAGTVSGTLTDVNERDEVLGTYTTADSVVHGFVKEPSGKFTRLDYPGLSALAVAEMPAKLNDGQGGFYDRVDAATLTMPLGFADREGITGLLGVGYADASGVVLFYQFTPDGFVANHAAGGH